MQEVGGVGKIGRYEETVLVKSGLNFTIFTVFLKVLQELFCLSEGIWYAVHGADLVLFRD